jgi:hypothetical protein
MKKTVFLLKRAKPVGTVRGKVGAEPKNGRHLVPHERRYAKKNPSNDLAPNLLLFPLPRYGDR